MLIAEAGEESNLQSEKTAHGQLKYPGPSPGAATIAVNGTTINVSNQALSMSWNLSVQGLRAGWVRDEQLQRQLPLAGEVFEIVLKGGQRYAASTLKRESEARVLELQPDPRAARLAARIPGRQVEVRLRSADGRLQVIWSATVHDDANYVRQEVRVISMLGELDVQEIRWLDQLLPGARMMGRVDGSPVVAGHFFFACEDPLAINETEDSQEKAGPTDSGGTVSCRLPRNAVLPKWQSLTVSFVTGVVPEGQLRRGFLYYLERERAHPYRPFLHYNSWYDTAWQPFALNETNCLEAIRLFGERFVQPHGVVLDAMVFDDGWDNPQTLWQFHDGFPNGFTPPAQLCQQYHTRLGVWLSPFGGYGTPKEQRLKFGREQGYETNPTGFSLAGPKYYAAFRQACVDMIRKYGVNHFKFDGIAAGTYASGGAAYVLDAEAMRRLMLELRQEDPQVYINLTTGSWPSPFWLRHADSVWRQGGDMGLAGKGPRQQQWLTYRDQETYRNIVGKGPLYPLNALMTQGVAYSRQGSAGDPTFNSAGFKDDVRAFFGAGTSLQELYIQPGKLTADDWQVLAEAAKWSRANADVLVDTHWIGGDPGQLEVYGYASWSPRKGILMLRNPDDQPREFALDVGQAFELPAGAVSIFTLRSPWVEDVSRPALTAEAGKPLHVKLNPFEVLVLDATPIP
jgi:hypothetical protein